jgi:hypothetical protein
MQTAAPSSSNAPKAGPSVERVSGSFQIDPALTREATSQSRPRSATPIQGSAILKPTANKTPAPRHPTPIANELGERKSRISGTFNAVESDFFAREADLYKDEGVESFHDLDEKSKGSTKGKPQNKRPRK